MKTYVIAGVHGDEVFGLKIIGAIDRSSNQNITTVVGHAEAIAKKRRFIESDLNRSFELKSHTIESRIAKSISDNLRNNLHDYIIDIHTSRSNVKSVAIVAKLNDTTIYLAHMLETDAIVIMPPQLTSTSLIGCQPEKSISLEYGAGQRSDKLAIKTAEVIMSLGDIQEIKHDLPIYAVISRIPKDYEGLSGIKNLEYDVTLNGYPFLAGVDTYPDFGGFLAKKLNKNTSDNNIVYNGE
ncbi:succinylglutamate desuccinylase/aspartoacylase family protein [Candidatus Nomurabacteria bacterium]|nr:succinylglutamate desuccinylase/aspartoacylase family protein [Candidatus Nomurabacteria bacterium]